MKLTVRTIVGAACALSMAAGLLGVAGLVPAVSVGKPAQDRASLGAAALRAFQAELANRAAPDEATRGLGAAVSNSVSPAGSINWAGYVDASATVGKFTSVSGSWVVPAVSCTPEDRIMSVWVGLDGATNATVEQAGVAAQCFRNTARYFSWYEMFPAGSKTVGRTVKPGDRITASVSRRGTIYTLKLTDSTTSRNSFTKSASCASTICKDQSVEWIVERPRSAPPEWRRSHSFPRPPSLPPGPQLGARQATSPRSARPSSQPWSIRVETYALETTSVLNATRKGFSVTWLNSY